MVNQRIKKAPKLMTNPTVHFYQQIKSRLVPLAKSMMDHFLKLLKCNSPSSILSGSLT